MAKRGNIDIIGDKEFRKVMKALPDRTTRKVMLGIFRQAGKPVRDEAKRRVPVKEKILQRSIGFITGRKKGRSANAAVLWIGPRTRKGSKYPGYHAHLIEYGTAPHRIDSSVLINGTWRYIGLHPGTPPQPFMRPAIDSKKAQVEQDIGSQLGSFLKKELKKIKRSGIRGFKKGKSSLIKI